MSTTTTKARKSTAATKTAKASKTSTKPTVSPASKAAVAAKTPASAPTVVEAPQAVIMGPVMRKKELVEEVVTRSGKKKKDVKPVVEMMLSVLGEAIADNRELNLQPFGKLKVRKEKKLSNGRIIVTKIRQNEPVAAADGPKKAESGT
ncbi:HU family DNA-binding protein [Marimonas sp. MJW-29]|uniref:HU family DNA-binding protein n=1 Tax=Sulfitobacter sediminis TaxID=3234186 RepID=A0ABV3RID5_9RHOB